MRLFRKPPPVVRTLVRQVPRPWNQPETEFPGSVLIDSLQFDRSEQTAIAITGILAYTTGFEVFVTRLILPGAPGLDAGPPSGTPREIGLQRGFQISLQLADGSTVTDQRPHGDAAPTGPILTQRGGGTSHYRLTRWAWPLPPPGPVEFSCQWPMFGIDETRASIDAQLILDASQSSVRVWPQGED
jgi:hypothetical protein